MSWFKRKGKGIHTSTEEKKIPRKDFGTNPQQEKL